MVLMKKLVPVVVITASLLVITTQPSAAYSVTVSDTVGDTENGFADIVNATISKDAADSEYTHFSVKMNADIPADTFLSAGTDQGGGDQEWYLIAFSLVLNLNNVKDIWIYWKSEPWYIEVSQFFGDGQFFGDKIWRQNYPNSSSYLTLDGDTLTVKIPSEYLENASSFDWYARCEYTKFENNELVSVDSDSIPDNISYDNTFSYPSTETSGSVNSTDGHIFSTGVLALATVLAFREVKRKKLSE